MNVLLNLMAALNSVPDPRGQREPLLELLGDEAAAALRLGLVLGLGRDSVHFRNVTKMS